MNEKIKTICLILITLNIISGAIFYCYVIYDKHLMNKEKQQAEINFKKEQIKIEKEEKEKTEKEIVKNKFLLNICLESADTEASDYWDRECEEMGRSKDCQLPVYKAEAVEDYRQTEKDECFKKYPQK